MKTYARIKDNTIVTYARFEDGSPPPVGWVDVTGKECSKGWPLDAEKNPIAQPSKFHTIIEGNTGWEINPDNKTKKDAKLAEKIRHQKFIDEQKNHEWLGNSPGEIKTKIDKLFEGATTVALVRAATIEALKLMVGYRLK